MTDLFHKLLELIDKNSENIPEGDYMEICSIIKQIHDKVKNIHQVDHEELVHYLFPNRLSPMSRMLEEMFEQMWIARSAHVAPPVQDT